MGKQACEKQQRKPCGIINHWMVNNYGALLLAYALEKALIGMGYEVESVTWLPDEVRKPWKLSVMKKVGLLTYLMRLGYFLVFILPRQRAFAHMRAQMRTTQKVYTDATIHRLNDDFDKIIVGGDQLWNYKINYYNPNNFLPFIKERNRKLVYAASIAQDEMRPGFEDEFKRLVSGFGYITTREDRATELIEQYAGMPAQRVTDPAFLLPPEEWAALCDETPDMKERYVFVYQVQSDVAVIRLAQQKAKELGCKVVYCPFPLKKQIKCKRKPYLSPERWLGYMKNAECVVTDAFHGVVFSMLFGRPFYAQISSYGKDTASRITNILDVYSLQDRLFTSVEDATQAEIDYHAVRQVMEKERAEGLKHLQRMMAL